MDNIGLQGIVDQCSSVVILIVHVSACLMMKPWGGGGRGYMRTINETLINA